MKFFILSLLSISSALFGQVAVTENEPSALVEGIVNIITGDLYALEDDIVIQGAEPLRLKRSYISAKGEGRWRFFENLGAMLYPPITLLQVNEPNGTLLEYRYDFQEIKHKKKHKKKEGKLLFHPFNLSLDGQGLSNTARGKISAQTNLKNQYISMEKGAEQFTVICPNGAKRTYKAFEDQKSEKSGAGFKMYVFYKYALHLEELPNGNKVIYEWHKRDLKSIRTTDPSGKKTYAQATFRFHGKIEEKHGKSYLSTPDFDIETSDGRLLQYRYFCEGKPHEHGIWYLHQILSSDFPAEAIHYHGKDDNRKRILAAVALPNSRNLHIGYYPSGKDSVSSRVQVLLAPVGRDNTSLVTHKFYYDTAKRMASVTDIEDIQTHYFWDENLHLTSIDRFTHSQLYCSTVFSWGANDGKDATNLLCKALCDESRKPIYATTYLYDTRGNVLLEKFYGNLTGQGTSLTLDAGRMPIENGVEAYSRKSEYSQDGRNLLLRKEEDSGLVVTYDYSSNTDLLTSELSYDHGQIKRRKFYEYNSENILIREINDDGTTPDKNNLSGVKTRLIQQIYLKPDAPFLNMPHTIEDKYWDGHEEKLLKKTTLHYTTGGRIEKKDVYDAKGTFCYSLKFKYDVKGHLSEEVNAIGQSALSSYDELGNKIFFQDFSGRTQVRMSYDYSNRLIESKEVGDDGCARNTRHEYDRKHNKTLTIDPHGYETRYVFDALNQLIETHLPKDLHLTSTYDAAGLEITHTDAKGFTTHTAYNAYGKPISILHPDETQERFIYNLNGTLCTHIDQNEVETAYLYDAFNRTVSITKSFQGKTLSQETFIYDGFHLITKTDAEGNITTYKYDGAGRKIAGELNEERLEYTYDSLGRLHSIKKGELIAITKYDLLNRITEERKEDAQGNLLSKVGYTYDSAGNKKTITRFIDGKEAVEHFEYDAFSRLIKREDPLGNVTTTVYDDNHHSQTTTDPLGLQTIEYFNAYDLPSSLEQSSSHTRIREDNLYDANNNLIAKETTIFNPNRTVTTLWDYGPLNRLKTLTEAAGTPEQKVTSYTYTSTGQLFQTTKPSGIVLTNTYDLLGHLSSQSSSDGTIHYTYKHDRLGHLLSSIDELNKTALIRTYDPKGRLLSEKLPNDLSIQNRYDHQGRRIRLNLPDDSYVTYTYDPLHLRNVTRYNSSASPLYTHTYTAYDLAGNSLSQELIANLGSLTLTHDLNNRPTSLISPHFSHEILQYDFVGNILKSRLNNAVLEYTYDDLYQLTSEKDHIYAYDALYNRLCKDARSFEFNALNQLSAEFKYDPDGNLKLHGEFSYTYDAFDRLIAVKNSFICLNFTYDSYHRRLSKTIYRFEKDSWKPTQTFFFLYDDQNEIGSCDAAFNIQELRILGPTPRAEIGSAIALELYGSVFAPIHDLYGNLTTLISLDRTYANYRYTAFGEEQKPKLNSPNPRLLLSNPWRFSSKRIDGETGLVYFGRRYYLPAYGRWLTQDPLGFEAGPNLYAYVSNAPLTHVDLYGLFPNSFDDWKQMSIGAIHGVGNFTLNTASTVSTIGWGLTTPFRAVNWMAGRSSFSQDWHSFQCSNAAFHELGSRWMQRALPGDYHHEMYRTWRSGVSDGMEISTLLAGGVGIAKGAYSLVQRGMSTIQKLGRSSMPMRESSEIFNRAQNFLKPYSKEFMPEMQIRELIHCTGIRTFPRPTGIPENFRVKLSNNGAGMKYVHPQSEQTYIRIMPGKPHSPFPHQQKPYAVHMKDGKTFDKFGNVVISKSPEAHIPLDEFIYRD